MKKYLLFAFIFFLFLSLSEFFLGRRQLLSGPAAPFEVTLVEPPVSAPAGSQLKLSWRVYTPTPRQIESTAVLVDDRPTPDYLKGQFASPDILTATVSLPTQVDSVTLKAYAQIEGQTYWSQPYQLSLQ